MDRKVNIGIIGGGWIAEYAHIPQLLKNNNVKLVAVMDNDSERAKYLGERYLIPYICSSLEELFNCELDGVIISTPNYTHYTYTCEALKRGIGVLCEKPVALSISGMNEIVRICTEKNTVYVPGFVNRWRQDIQMLKCVIEKGELGDIISIDAGWLRKAGVPRPGTWFTSKKYAGGGVLTDLGSHILDLCLMFIGGQQVIDCKLKTLECNSEEEIQSGAAGWFSKEGGSRFMIDVEESAIADIRFKGGIKLHTVLSWHAPVKADSTYFKITGSKGRVELKTLFGFSNERLWKEDQLTLSREGKEQVFILDKKINNTMNAFGDMLSYFTEALVKGETKSVNYKDAYRIVSVTEKLYRSNEKNMICHISVPEEE